MIMWCQTPQYPKCIEWGLEPPRLVRSEDQKRGFSHYTYGMIPEMYKVGFGTPALSTVQGPETRFLPLQSTV